MGSIARGQRRVWWKWAAALGVCAISGAAYWLVVRPPRPSAPPETTLRRLTNMPGLTTDAAISPDGKLVAYVRNGNIWVQQVDGSGLIQITDDPAGDSAPAFSPDGTQIAFRSERAGGAIYIAPALGGEARELVPQGRRPRFSPDGRWLMYWIGPAIPGDLRGSTQVNLFVQPVSGGTPTQVGNGCGLMERTPVWSPDGSRILFVGSCGSDVATVWVCAVAGKDVRPNRDLYAFWREIHSQPVIDQWVADPPRVLIPLRVGDATYVTAVPISADGTKVTGPSQKLAVLTDNLTRASAALNGRMVFSVSASTSHIWSLPIDGKGRAIGEPKQLTYGTAGELDPSLSRDGERVAFTSVRANGIRLFYRDLATAREKELSADGYRYETPVFNSDATGIIYVMYPDRESVRDSIYYVPLSGGLAKKIWDKSWSWLWDRAPDGKTLLLLTYADRPRERTFIRQLDLYSLSATTFLDDPGLELWQAHFSHDGRWVTFNATRNKQESRIYVVPFRKAFVPRSEWIATTDGGSDDKPRFSSDDKLLFFRSDRDGSRRILAQKLTSDKRPDGKPFAVYPLGQSKRSLVISDEEIGVGPQRIVFAQVESTGNIWLLAPAKGDAR
jgi:Tol biopolymer transport system component